MNIVHEQLFHHAKLKHISSFPLRKWLKLLVLISVHCKTEAPERGISEAVPGSDHTVLTLH